MACKHVNATELHAPSSSQSVYREDCTQCFDSIDDPSGLDVCLYCFNGGCTGERNHSQLHYRTHKHPLVLNIKRKRKQVNRDEPPQKISKLAISAETEQDRYETSTQVRCHDCGVDDVDSSSGKLQQVVDAVIKAKTFARQEEVKAWEQEMTACEHTLCLEQEQPRTIHSGDLGHCAMCDLKENLWLCLTCGNLGCGRQQYGGTGGNGHGLYHVDTTQHPVAVKLGSLTADGTADIYCYSCNEERVDPEIATHLANWGINIANRVKTEKSLTEMQIEQNLKWEFSMATADGKELKPLFGPGFTGLKNLGNSCYMNSIVQCLFSFPEFKQRYLHDDNTSAQKPAEDLETQLRKIADGLLSGRYAYPDRDVIVSEETTEVPHQKGIAPAMLKHLIGKGHAEFSTMRQQDAFEFLLHLLQLITRSQHPTDQPNPVNAFKFVIEQRLQCASCQKVRYRTDEMDNISIPVPIRRLPRSDLDSKMTDVDTKAEETASGDKADNTTPNSQEKEQFEPVTFKECLDIFTAAEEVELTCPSCSNKAFTKRSMFKTFPDILAINARRFEIVNWLPTKQDVPVIVSDEPISFEDYVSRGHQENEELLPEDTNTGGAATSSTAFVPNEAGLEMLTSMGFPTIRCVKALKETGNSDVEAASNWLFEHMDDADIDEPMPDESSPAVAGGGSSVTIDPSQIEDLGAMGFSAPQARQALKETGGDMERAVDWLFSHPDAQGDFGDDEPTPASSTSPSSSTEPKPLPGHTPDNNDPTSFQLQSIACHKGSSIHAGHYVAFIRKEIPDENNKQVWVLFNDEKVAKAEPENVEEMKKFAYVYFFKRIGA